MKAKQKGTGTWSNFSPQTFHFLGQLCRLEKGVTHPDGSGLGDSLKTYAAWEQLSEDVVCVLDMMHWQVWWISTFWRKPSCLRREPKRVLVDMPVFWQNTCEQFSAKVWSEEKWDPTNGRRSIITDCKCSFNCLSKGWSEQWGPCRNGVRLEWEEAGMLRTSQGYKWILSRKIGGSEDTTLESPAQYPSLSIFSTSWLPTTSHDKFSLTVNLSLLFWFPVTRIHHLSDWRAFVDSFVTSSHCVAQVWNEWKVSDSIIACPSSVCSSLVVIRTTIIFCTSLFLCLKQWKYQMQKLQWRKNGTNSKIPAWQLEICSNPGFLLEPGKNYFPRASGKSDANISSRSYDMEGRAKKCVERYCEQANRTTQQLYKVATPCTNLLVQSRNGPEPVTNARHVWSYTFTTQVNSNKIVMWVIPSRPK